MTSPAPAATTVLCHYRVRPGREAEFLALLGRHWPTLHRLGLVTEEPARVLRGEDEPGRTTFVELFTWRDAKAPDVAHGSPEVMALWEPMGALVEDRGGRPGMEFPHYERVELVPPTS